MEITALNELKNFIINESSEKKNFYPGGVYLGVFGEYERLRLEQNAVDFWGNRIGSGLTWMARTSDDFNVPIFFEFGGFGGASYATLKDLDSQTGFDFGIFRDRFFRSCPIFRLRFTLWTATGGIMATTGRDFRMCSPGCGCRPT